MADSVLVNHDRIGRLNDSITWVINDLGLDNTVCISGIKDVPEAGNIKEGLTFYKI